MREEEKKRGREEEGHEKSEQLKLGRVWIPVITQGRMFGTLD